MDEVHGLLTRLTSGPGGVVVLRGTRGVGKSKLVDAVLNDLSTENAALRIHRHDVNAITHLDVSTLVDSVAGDVEPATASWQRGSSLVRLETALRQLGDSRVVVSVDSVENLLDPDTKKVMDRDLDEALEMLVTEPDHHVTVLLVSQLEPESPADGTWPTAETPIHVGKLPFEEFLAYLATLDRHGRTDPANLSEASRLDLYKRLQGNPRLAELAYAVVTVAESGIDLPDLTDRLSAQQTREVPTFLTSILADTVRPLQRQVLQALAAFDTRVPATAVAGLLREDPAMVRQALSTLTAHRVVYRTATNEYFVPSADAHLLIGHMPGKRKRSRLYFFAASELTKLRNRDPRQVSHLRVHFAELTALLRAGEPGAAYEMIELIDDVLSEWNCSHLLRDQREEVQRNLRDDYLKMANDNALGGIYVSLGDFTQADTAYGKALRTAIVRRDDVRRMRIYGNLAAMYWEQNDTNNALGYFELARDEAARLYDPPVRMGAMEGIADCHRRRGDYDNAIRHAETALAVPELAEYPDTLGARRFAVSRSVAISLKLARWLGELGRANDAARYINVAHDSFTEHTDDWLRSSYLDGLADMLFDRGDFEPGVLEQAEEAAQAAEEQARLLRDPIILLQARTTLCLIYQKRNQLPEARRAIERARYYRREGRSLVVLALLALADQQRTDRAAARTRFRRLHAEASARIERDEQDFAAWDFKGYAICGQYLDTRHDLTEAIEAIQFARRRTPPTPALVRRLLLLFERLDAASRRPGQLRTVIDALAIHQ